MSVKTCSEKKTETLSESYALLNFQFFPSLDFIDKYFSIFNVFNFRKTANCSCS